jgi:hypothetical protein
VTPGIDYFGDDEQADGITKHFADEDKPRRCNECHAPTFNPRLCNACFDLDRTVRDRRWFVEKHDEWKAEQAKKRRLISGDGYI